MAQSLPGLTCQWFKRMIPDDCESCSVGVGVPWYYDYDYGLWPMTVLCYVTLRYVMLHMLSFVLLFMLRILRGVFLIPWFDPGSVRSLCVRLRQKKAGKIDVIHTVLYYELWFWFDTTDWLDITYLLPISKKPSHDMRFCAIRRHDMFFIIEDLEYDSESWAVETWIMMSWAIVHVVRSHR